MALERTEGGAVASAGARGVMNRNADHGGKRWPPWDHGEQAGSYGLIVTNAVPIVELERFEITLMVCRVDCVTELGGEN